jgi:ubiquinone biosynthesis protein UbiJ
MLEPALLAGLNHLLNQAGWARSRLVPFAGKLAVFEIPPFHLSLAVGNEGFFEPVATSASAPDVMIRLPAETPLLLVQGLDRAMAAARVEGNAEFATELSFVLRNLRWDVEEDLSRVIGDIAARRVTQGVQQFAGWQRQAAGNLAGNLREYLVYENPLLVQGVESAQFRIEVSQFIASLDAIERRINRLAPQTSPS